MNKSIKYTFSLERTVLRLAELGLDEDEINQALGLTRNQFDELIKDKKISSALEKGRGNCARKVEQALYKRATGFEFEEIVNTNSESPSGTGSTGTNGNGKTKSVSKSTVKNIMPDVTACIFWLKNRLPDKWRDPKDIETNRKKSIQDLVEEYEAKGFEEDD